MTGADLNRLERFAEELPRFFYLIMAVALLAVLVGSPVSGLLLLILGSAAHVVRASLEDFVESRRAREDELKAAPRNDSSPFAGRPRRSRSVVPAGDLADDRPQMAMRSRR